MTDPLNRLNIVPPSAPDAGGVVYPSFWIITAWGHVPLNKVYMRPRESGLDPRAVRAARKIAKRLLVPPPVVA